MQFNISLSQQELDILAVAMYLADRADAEFTNIKTRRIRKMFCEEIEHRHKLWLKIIHASDKEVVKG